jgi:rod shape-determining protein MreD
VGPRVRVSRLALYGTVLALFYVETAFMDPVRFMGMRPELMLVAVLFFGLHFGVATGAETGLFAGVLKDMLSVSHFGVNTCLFVIAGSLAGYLRNKVMRENFVTYFFLSAAAACMISGFYVLYLRELAGTEISAHFWKSCFHKGLYTGLAAPFLFFLLTRMLGPRHA